MTQGVGNEPSQGFPESSPSLLSTKEIWRRGESQARAPRNAAYDGEGGGRDQLPKVEPRGTGGDLKAM